MGQQVDAASALETTLTELTAAASATALALGSQSQRISANKASITSLQAAAVVESEIDTEQQELIDELGADLQALEALHEEQPQPPTPPDDGIPVPEDADEAWFLSHPQSPTFLFERPFGEIPLMEGATYQGNVQLVSDGDYFTPRGELVQNLRALASTGPRATLTRPSRGRLFYPVAGQSPADDFLITGFEITGNDAHTNIQEGVIDLRPHQRGAVVGNHFHHNEDTDVRVGAECRVQGNIFEESEHLGVGGLARFVDVSRNVFRQNTAGHERFNWEAGGLKLVIGDGAIHHNLVTNERAIGLWTDIDAEYDIYSNVCIGSRGPGIFAAELTRPGALIDVSDNHLEGNGHTAWANQWGVMRAQLLLAAGDGIRVDGNLIRQTGSGQHGLSIVQQYRTRNGRIYYVDHIEIVRNIFERSGTSKPRIGVYDDTGSRTSPPEFIPYYAGNWNNPNVPDDRKASINQGTWASIGAVNTF